MKTMRYLLITFAMMMVMSISAQEFAEMPRAEFHSTSSMVTSGSTLPQAAQSGAYTTYDTDYSGRSNKPGIRTAGGGGSSSGGPEDREDPYYTPIGEGMLPLALLAFAYFVVRVMRKRRGMSRFAE